MESQLAIPQRTEPRAIPVKQKAYAFERSLGIPPAEACRRAGGKVENGHATKWERSARVQAWIVYFRSLGHTEEMLAEKRRRVEDELRLVAHANMADFITINGTMPVLDLSRIEAMAEPEKRAALASVKTIRYTENGPTFELHGKLEALAQLRDMHGFKAPARTEHSGELVVSNVIRAPAVSATTAEWQAQHVPESQS